MADYSTWASQSSPYDDTISQAEQKYGLPAGLLRKQLIVESGLNPKATSSAPGSHAAGIAQFQPSTAASMGLTDPMDPNASIEAAAKMDAQLYQRFGNWGKAMLAYHDGPHAVASGRISPAALAYRQSITSVPDFKPPAAPASASTSGDPFASVDAAHAQSATQSNAPDPFASVDAAHAQASGQPAIPPAPTDEQKRAAQETQADLAARKTYDESDFPTRTLISAGQGMEDFVHGAQGVGADIGQGVGKLIGSNALVQAAQAKRNELAQNETQVANARAGEHGGSNFLGQALPYVATAPLGGPEAGAARALLPRLGLSAVRNALVGGAMGGVATTPTTAAGTAPTLEQDVAQRAKNSLVGAATGAVLGPTLEGAGTAIGAAAKGVSNKLTSAFGGAERTAASHVASIVPEGMGAPDYSATSKVPGYTPSAAEATGDPRLAWLDKQMRSKYDDYRAQAEATDQANHAAMQNVVDSLRGDRTTLAKAYDNRQAQTAPLYQQAAQQAAQAGARVDTTPVWSTVRNLMAAKQGETSVTDALGKYLKPGSLYDQLPDGRFKLTNDIQRLANIRNQMSTDIGKQFSTDSAGNDMKAAARPLMQVRDVIDQQLAQANPALAAARQKFGELSTDINRQDYLQGLLPPEKDGKLTAAQLARVLTNVAQDQGASGANPAKSITPDQVRQLRDLHDVLAHRENVSRMQPGADVKDQVRGVTQATADSGASNALLTGERAAQVGGALAGGAAGFLGLSHLHPASVPYATMAGSAVGSTLARSAARAAERNPAETRSAMANFLLDPQSHPLPNVAPSAYKRSATGQQAAEGMARGATNALTQGQRP